MYNNINLFYIFKFKTFIYYEMNQFNSVEPQIWNLWLWMLVITLHRPRYPVSFYMLFCVHFIKSIHFMKVLPTLVQLIWLILLYLSSSSLLKFLFFNSNFKVKKSTQNIKVLKLELSAAATVDLCYLNMPLVSGVSLILHNSLSAENLHRAMPRAFPGISWSSTCGNWRSIHIALYAWTCSALHFFKRPMQSGGLLISNTRLRVSAAAGVTAETACRALFENLLQSLLSPT